MTRWVSLHDVLEDVSQVEVDDPKYPARTPQILADGEDHIDWRTEGPPPHGSVGRYSRYGCRCSMCRDASAEARRRQRAKTKS